MTDDIAGYIDEVSLGGPLGLAEENLGLPQLAGVGAESAVVDSSMYSFSEALPGEQHQGVANWLLFAQLAASAQVPDPEDAAGWCAAYQDALERTGWARTGIDSGWQEERSIGFTVHEKILPVIAAILGPATAAAALVTLALNSLNDMAADNPRITLFDRRAQSVSRVGFQVGIADVAPEGGVVLSGAEYRLEASQTLTQVLWFEFTTNNGRFYYRRLGRWLSQEKYDQHHEAIKARVDAYISNSIADIPLKPPAA